MLRSDELLPRAMKLHADMEVVANAVKDMSDGYAAIYESESNIIQVLNRNRSFPISAMDDFPVLKWESIVTGLKPTTDGPQAHEIFNSLRDVILLDVGNLISGIMRSYGRFGARMEKQYKQIRTPAWSPDGRRTRKLIEDDVERAEEQIATQEKAVREWATNTSNEWIGVHENATRNLDRLCREMDISKLFPDQIAIWQTKGTADRDQDLINLVSQTMDTEREKQLEHGAYMDTWRNIRRWAAVMLVKQVEVELNTLYVACDRMLRSASQQFPDLVVKEEPME